MALDTASTQITVVGAVSKARPPPMNLLREECKAIKSVQDDDQLSWDEPQW